MANRLPYFSLYEIALLSLFGALVFVVRTAVEVPLRIPGNSGVLWVIPVIVGTALVRKPGAGAYIGIISGTLASFFGLEALHAFDIFKYAALGITVDIVAIGFGYRLEHPAVGFIAGAAGNLAKMVVNYAVHLLFGVQGIFILIGIGMSSITHLIFGGLGGVLAALIIARLGRAGVVQQGDASDDG
jgi:hypothetical protein